MKWIEAKVFFEAEEPSWALELICDIFRDLCTQGIVVEDPFAEPSEGWGPDGRKPGDYYAVTGYFPSNRQGENKRQLLEENISGLAQHYNISTRIVYKSIHEQDWANCWKQYFKPQKIGERIVVKPTWHRYNANEGDIVLEIDPGMAFGTGTHPTTAMCVCMLERYLKKNDFFLDVGTGSGILLLTAHGLGAARVIGTDQDETAVAVARQNLLKNHVPPEKFGLVAAHLVEGVRGKFHVVAANILSEVIVLLLDKLSEILVPEGFFIASGIIEDNRDMVIEKMLQENLKVIHTEVREQWVVIVAQKVN